MTDDFNTGEGPSFRDFREGGFRHVLDREHLERFTKPKQYKEPFEPVAGDYTRGVVPMDANKFVGGKYLKAADLKSKLVKVTIDSVAEEETPDGESKLVLYFQGKDKALMLNKVNTSTIIDQLGTTDTDEWQGAQIVLKTERTNYNGQMVPCIRIGDKVKGQVVKPKAAVREADGVGPDDDITDADVPFTVFLAPILAGVLSVGRLLA